MKRTQDLGKKLFFFAVVADTHLNQDEVACILPKQENAPLAKEKIEEIALKMTLSKQASQIQIVDAVSGIKHGVQDMDSAQPVYLLCIS